MDLSCQSHIRRSVQEWLCSLEADIRKNSQTENHSCKRKPAPGVTWSRQLVFHATYPPLSTDDSNSPAEAVEADNTRKGSMRADKASAVVKAEGHWQPAAAPLARLQGSQ